jgi:hypothetical protein
MKLKYLLEVIAPDQKICVVDDMGPYNDAAPLNEVPVSSLIYAVDREVTKVYYDDDDDTITIELEEWSESKEEKETC